MFPGEPAPGPFLYPIVDTGVCAARGLDPAEVAAAYLAAGARLLQIRDKDGSSGAFLSLADRVVRAAAPRHAPVIINDRADIARLI